MWEKRKDDPRSATQRGIPAPQQTPAAVAVAPRPETPPPPPQAAPPPRTTIGSAIRIKGEIHSKEDLYLDGEIEGKLELAERHLTVGPKGKVNSDIRAGEVTIFGSVKGNVHASQKLAIRKDGQMVGNITTSGITIDDEAYFKGNIDIVRKDDKAKAAGR